MKTNTQTNPCISDAGWTGIYQQSKVLVPPSESFLGCTCAMFKWSRLIRTTLRTCCLLCLMWPSQMALCQQAHYPQMALELRCLCGQLLPQVHLSQSALDWNWWVINSSYAGSGCALPHPWGIPHKLVHWDRTTFPLHIPNFPIGPVFYDSPWRQLHGLGLCPQPPRLLPCFFYCNSIYGIVLPWFLPFYGPISHVLTSFAWILRWWVS